MKKKNIIIIVSIVIVATILSLLLVYNYQTKKTKKNYKQTTNKIEKKKCIPFTGGGFNLIFNTNGGEAINNMHVGIAINPDSYQDLPIPTKENYSFDGWYYDNELQTKVECTNSKDIKPVPEYDKNKCMIGYKDIELYAKWVEQPQERIQESINNEENNINQNETIIQNNTPEVISTRIYKPSNNGTVISPTSYRYGAFQGMIVSAPYGSLLYPINDGEYIKEHINSTSNYTYSYFIYKTTIDNTPYYVMYQTDGVIQFAKTENDYNNSNRILKYNEPIGYLKNRKYTVYITQVFSNNIYEIIKGMNQGKEYQVNANLFFKLNVGETFTETR